MKHVKGLPLFLLCIALSVAATYMAADYISDPAAREPEKIKTVEDRIVPKKEKKEKKQKKKKKYEKNEEVDKLEVHHSTDGGEGKAEAFQLASTSFGALKDGTYFGNAVGYGGNLRVRVVVKNGKITGVTVVSHNETPEYYARAAHIAKQIVARQSLGVDGVSGATVTRNAIVMAVSRALAGAGGKVEEPEIIPPNEEPQDGGTGKGSKVVDLSDDTKGPDEPDEPSGTTPGQPSGKPYRKYADGVYRGQGTGYEGPVIVEVTVKEDRIVRVDVISQNETPEYWVLAKRIIGEFPHLKNYKDVDNVTGATISRNAILLAVHDAMKKSKRQAALDRKREAEKHPGTVTPGPHKPGEPVDPDKPVTPVDPDEPVDPDDPDEPLPLPPVVQREVPLDYEAYKKEQAVAEKRTIDLEAVPDGTYSAEATGFNGKNRVTIMVEDGMIIDIEIEHKDDLSYFTEDYRDGLKSCLERTVNVPSVKAFSDSISGATYSGNSVLAAIKDALKGFKKQGINVRYLKENIIYREDADRNTKYLYVPEDIGAVQVKNGTENMPLAAVGEYIVFDLKDLNEAKPIRVTDSSGRVVTEDILRDVKEVKVSQKVQKTLEEALSEKIHPVQAVMVEDPEKPEEVTPLDLSYIVIGNEKTLKVVESDKDPAPLDKKELVKAYAFEETGDTAYYAILPYKPEEDVEYRLAVHDSEKDMDVVTETQSFVYGEQKYFLMRGDCRLLIVKDKEEEQSTYVQDIVQDYTAPMFVRPPELNSKLYDGVYIGHGKGYYKDLPIGFSDKRTEYNSYTQNVKVKMTVKDGKIADIELIHFGDDVAAGGKGYKAKAEPFRVKIFELAKKDMNGFIKHHLDIERFVQACKRGESKYYKPLPGDDFDKVLEEVAPKVTDARCGATFSAAAYSRSIAEAMYKASRNEKQINDMYLEDYDYDTAIFTEVLKQTNDQIRQYRIDHGYHQTRYLNGESLDLSKLVLTIEYTDGSKESIPYADLEKHGYQITCISKDGYKEIPIPTGPMEKDYYGMWMYIRNTGATTLPSDYVNTFIWTYGPN